MIVDVINSKEDLIHGVPATDKEIKNAEDDLDLKFASEYKDYLKTFGIIAYEGHEITGISRPARTHVVDVTKKLKNNNANIDADMYVVEETNYDGIVIWQKQNGSIYETVGNSIPKQIYESLSQYVEN